MRNTLAAAILLAISANVNAQSTSVPKEVIDQIGRDLSNLQQAVIAAQAQAQQASANPGGKGWGLGFLGKVSVTSPTDLRAGAAETSPKIYKTSKGQTFPVVAQAGDWFAVSLDQPAAGYTTAWLPAAYASPVAAEVQMHSMASGADVFSKLTEQASKMKQAYESNRYVNVSGFSVNVFPPSVSINFEFKK